ncbi:uncharacterized protein METZ01_LOCUS327020 [marine metagenome]|uniref:Uncharacterized protein n=1 Tax=marine metagenome TaxID=408172 RepID=A0A382PLN4_9ZZZZ
MAGEKKVFVIAKLGKSVPKKEHKELQNKRFLNRGAYPASQKAATAIFKTTPKSVNKISYIIENKKTGKQSGYTATKTGATQKVTISGKEFTFPTSPKIKACLVTEV